jgi:hypothetical protein
LRCDSFCRFVLTSVSPIQPKSRPGLGPCGQLQQGISFPAGSGRSRSARRLGFIFPLSGFLRQIHRPVLSLGLWVSVTAVHLSPLHLSSTIAIDLNCSFLIVWLESIKMYSTIVNNVHDTVAHARSEPSNLDRTAERGPNSGCYSYNTQIQRTPSQQQQPTIVSSWSGLHAKKLSTPPLPFFFAHVPKFVARPFYCRSLRLALISLLPGWFLPLLFLAAGFLLDWSTRQRRQAPVSAVDFLIQLPLSKIIV